MNSTLKFLSAFLLLGSLFLSIGCTYSVEKKYVYAKPYYPNQNYFNEENPQFEEGKPYWLLDFLGNIFGVLSKLILWNKK
ncbi:hypothetical protein LEP1GSC133_2400 [Leptospira borgpetersenii serovar Pomona str. 200901868]|nr:hypothetical protein LEP1GSC133_2400 [Leptospira borgpetersenii serovar Pomona str. 200901868]